MTGTALAALIRRKTRTTTSTYLDADMLVDVNLGIEELAGRIQEVRPEVWNMPAVADLEADRREYAVLSDVLHNIVSLEIKFSSSDDYVPATALKKQPSGFALQESLIVAAYDNYAPQYFIRRKAVYILSGTITAVTDGLKIVANIFPDALANLTGVVDLSVDPSTTSHGFPREFHELLARRVSIGYKGYNGIPLDEKELMYEDDLEAKLVEYSTSNLDIEEIAEMPSPVSMGNHGFDY